MLAKNNPNFIPAETDPWKSAHGWFRPADEPGVRIEGSAHVSGDARVSGNAHVSGDARVYGDSQVSGNALVSDTARVFGNALVFGGRLVHLAQTASCVRWIGNLTQPGIVQVGCVDAPITDWLADPSDNKIPWAEHCTPAEVEIVQAQVRVFQMAEAAGLVWEAALGEKEGE